MGLLKEKNGNILLEGLMIQMSQPKSGIEQCTIKPRYAIPLLASQRMIYYFLVLHLNSFFFLNINAFSFMYIMASLLRPKSDDELELLLKVYVEDRFSVLGKKIS